MCLISHHDPINQSHHTYSFGERAKRVKNRAVVNEERSAFELQQLLNAALAEKERLRALLQRYQQSDAPPSTFVPITAVAPKGEARDDGNEKEEEGEGGDGGDRSGSSNSSSSGGGRSSAGGGDAEDGDIVDLSPQPPQGQEPETGRDEGLWVATEIELARLRALLAAKDEETAQLSMVNVQLRTRLKEEAAAMTTSLEEQRILEARLREAEANLDQLMRALAAAKDTSSSMEGQAAAAATATAATGTVPQEEASVRAAEAEAQPFSPRSPSAQQVYEEKLVSVEKVCSFLQDELENQRVRCVGFGH